MSNFAAQLSFKLASMAKGGAHTFFSPPTWPPPADWVVSLDDQGNPLSLWNDENWDFSPWAGKSFKIFFLKTHGSRNIGKLDPRNELVLRLATTYLIWGPRGTRSWDSLRNVFNIFRRLVVFCDQKEILAAELFRFPALIEDLNKLYKTEQERKTLLLTLHRMLRAADELGFTILDEFSLSLLAKSFKEIASHDTVQTAYIPPRIWNHQLVRLRECLDDFIERSQAYEECYNFCLDAYAHNFGDLKSVFASTNNTNTGLLPFSNKHVKESKNGMVYHGSFEDVAKKFEIYEVLEKWVAPSNGVLTIKSLSTYAKLVQFAAICYICNFTLQRKEEVADLRLDCLLWDEDPILGKVAIIRGETTKTDPDSDARWPASPSVDTAVQAAKILNRIRMRCVLELRSQSLVNFNIDTTTILQYSVEPWSGRRDAEQYGRVTTLTYANMLKIFPKLLDDDVIRIRDEDITIAKMFTPNIQKNANFAVGERWPFAFHQLRRTSGINMFASGLLSASSIQVVMKHLTMLQTMYYGRNFSHARFNEEVEEITSAARFEVLAKNIETLMDERYVSPLGSLRKDEIIVNIIGEKDFKRLVRAGKNGEITFRETRLGGCAKPGFCDYGGYESVANCSGYEGKKPCADAIFDVNKRATIETQLKSIESLLDENSDDGPRRRVLVSEAQGMRRYLDAIRKRDC